jgi:hypothetical protein
MIESNKLILKISRGVGNFDHQMALEFVPSQVWDGEGRLCDRWVNKFMTFCYAASLQPCGNTTSFFTTGILSVILSRHFSLRTCKEHQLNPARKPRVYKMQKITSYRVHSSGQVQAWFRLVVVGHIVSFPVVCQILAYFFVFWTVSCYSTMASLGGGKQTLPSLWNQIDGSCHFGSDYGNSQQET